MELEKENNKEEENGEDIEENKENMEKPIDNNEEKFKDKDAISNVFLKTEDGISILKKPENVREKVLNAILTSDKDDIEEISEDEFNKLLESVKKKLDD